VAHLQEKSCERSCNELFFGRKRPIMNGALAENENLGVAHLQKKRI